MIVCNIARETSRYIVAGCEHGPIVNFLLDRGADVEGRDCYGESASHVAADNGQDVVARILLNHGTNVNDKGPFDATPRYSRILVWSI